MNADLKRLVALIAIIAAGFGAFTAGLFLMNIRSDLALAAGALLCVAAPAASGFVVWRMIKQEEQL